MKWCLCSVMYLDDEGIRELRGLKLKRVAFADCSTVTNTGMRHLGGMPLEVVEIAFCRGITGGAIVAVASEHLKSLTMYGCGTILEQHLQPLKLAPNLTSLDVRCSRNVFETHAFE